MALRTPLSVTPHLYMGDSTGRPLDKGVVYFGEQDKDPEFYPINLFSDDALTKPLAQPVHTKGGYLYDKGDMVEPHAKELIYSVKVLDSYGRKVFYKGAMMRNSWNDDVIEQINTAIIGSADAARQVAIDITNDAINNTAVEGGVLADTFVTATARSTEAISRTQRDKNSDTVSVKDFGAKGDGVTDDTIAINNAVNSGASVVFCPEGVYKLSDSIYLPENISFYCTGNAELQPILPITTFFSAIRVNNGCVVKVNVDGLDFPVYNDAKFTAVSGRIRTEMHNVTIKDCNFKNVMNGVRLDGANNCTITNNRVKTTGTSGILIGVWDGVNAIRNTITHNHFEDMGDTAVAFFSNHSDAVTAFNIIAHNHAIDTQRITGGYAYDFEGGKGEFKGFNLIAHNTVEYTKLSGFDQNGIVMKNALNGIIVGNIVKGNDARISQGVSIVGGKNIAVASNILSDLSVGITSSRVHECILSNNILRDCGRSSQAFPSIAFSGSGVKVMNNTISFNPESPKEETCGIRASTSVTGDSDLVGERWEITGNTITGYKGFGIHLGGTELTYLNKVIISDNNIQGTGTEAYYAIRVDRAKDLTIKGNTLQDMKNGVSLNRISNLLFTRNLIEDTKDIPTMSHALNLSVNIVTLDNYLLKDNIFGAVASKTPITPASMLTNEGLTMIGNIGFLDKNEGKTTSITSGTLIPHGLYATPNKIQITLAEDAEVSNIYATVSGSKNIQINFTGIEPASFYWSASV